MQTYSIVRDEDAIGATLDQIKTGLERLLASFDHLRVLLVPETKAQTIDFNPADPANKYQIGGLEKLTDRGVEICYRLFDMGKTRYAVATLMNISFGAATHRQKAWEKEGGLNRNRKPL
jgi:hypothetical protein